MKILPIILAGGSGSRLWPMSRTHFPKQFLALTDDDSMLQNTIKRLAGIDHMPALLICNEEHRFLVAEQLRSASIGNMGILLEPCGRNTAPATAIAALHAIKNGEDPLLLVLAADHLIQNENAFCHAVNKAITHAESGKLVTFGIVPSKPETGYGYIKRGAALRDDGYVVSSFVEKPDYKTAKSYIEDGGYYWNSGMFLFKASTYLNELSTFRSDILEKAKAAYEFSTKDLDFIRLNKEAFLDCPEESIDYAVMENTSNAVVHPMEADWSDVGSWSSLWEVSKKDGDGNALYGDTLVNQSRNCYINAPERLIAAVGLDNLVIVDTKDAILVAHRDKVQNVKDIVSNLKIKQRNEFRFHREVYQPWGSHDEIASGNRFIVKQLRVKPGEKTALQMHHHRAEHWVVVQGTAKVTNGERVFFLSENESTYISIGSVHRIENPGKIDLHLIEIRSGAYLGEDDILRIEEYGVENA